MRGTTRVQRRGKWRGCGGGNGRGLSRSVVERVRSFGGGGGGGGGW